MPVSVIWVFEVSSLPDLSYVLSAVSVSVVTLLVSPQDAERLTSANSQGQFQLALRNPLDLEEIKTGGVQLTQLLKAGVLPPPVVRGRPVKQIAAAPAAAPPPAPVYNVEVIKGDQRSSVKF